tara:strand:- start:3066 stop:3254 length:189 start_codon:yes stop_codon:yes gene_type:complete
MKNAVIIVAVTLIMASGCASTVTVGPKANDASYLGASADTSGAQVTLPFVKAEVARTKSKKK